MAVLSYLELNSKKNSLDELALVDEMYSVSLIQSIEFSLLELKS